MKNLTDLIDLANRGDSIEYLFFMGHRQKKGSAITEACLSQWYPSAFEVEGILYKTAEHYMMAAKARLFGDADALQEILESSTPAEAKLIGRRVKGYNDELWTQHRYALVVAGNYAKFTQNAKLKEYILSTNELILVEASPKDKIWGVGLGMDDPGLKTPSLWRGLNLLGFALMEVRELIRVANENSNTVTKHKKAYVMYGNSDNEEWDCVTVFDIPPYVMPDFTKVTVFDLQKKKGHEVTLPNGETIEVDIIRDVENNHFTLNVMQGNKQLVQVLCDVMVGVIFYSLNRAAVNIQISE